MGRVGFRGLFDGEHIFELKPLSSLGTRFTQQERFRRLFAPFLARRLEKDVRRGFDEMNRGGVWNRAIVPTTHRDGTGKA